MTISLVVAHFSTCLFKRYVVCLVYAQTARYQRMAGGAPPEVMIQSGVARLSYFEETQLSRKKKELANDFTENRK